MGAVGLILTWIIFSKEMTSADQLKESCFTCLQLFSYYSFFSLCSFSSWLISQFLILSYASFTPSKDKIKIKIEQHLGLKVLYWWMYMTQNYTNRVYLLFFLILNYHSKKKTSKFTKRAEGVALLVLL